MCDGKERMAIKAITRKSYKDVFDENGNIKLCGREACKKLIRLMQCRFPDVDFGNAETGFMNTDNIKKYITI